MNYAGIPLEQQRGLLPRCDECKAPGACVWQDYKQRVVCAKCESKRLEAARKEVQQ